MSQNVAVRVTVKNVNYDDATRATKPPVIRMSCVSPEGGTVTRVGKVHPIRPHATEALFFSRTMSEKIIDPPRSKSS